MDGDMTDDEVVKEEKECNSDESSTEDIEQETYNEEDKNELLNFEVSMQQRGNVTVLGNIAANTQEELAEDAEDSSEPIGLEETHSESLLPRSLSTQKKHLEIHYFFKSMASKKRRHRKQPLSNQADGGYTYEGNYHKMVVKKERKRQRKWLVKAWLLLDTTTQESLSVDSPVLVRLFKILKPKNTEEENYELIEALSTEDASSIHWVRWVTQLCTVLKLQKTDEEEHSVCDKVDWDDISGCHHQTRPEDLYSAATSGKPSWINYIGSMVAVVARVINLHSAQQVHEGVVLCSQMKAFLTNRWGILDAVLTRQSIAAIFSLLPVMFDLIFLFAVAMYFFAVIGVEAFHHLNTATCSNGHQMACGVGFRTLKCSYYSLVQVVVNNNWSNIMVQALHQVLCIVTQDSIYRDYKGCK
eukprot:Em0006g653a